MRAHLPLTWLHENVLFGDHGEHAAVFRLETVSYPFLPDADKRSLRVDLASLWSVIGADFSLYIPRRVIPETGGIREHNVPEVYLLATLDRTRRSGLDRRVRRVMPSRVAPVGERALTALLDDRDSMLARIAACHQARSATTHEIQWLIRRAATRGFGEPTLDRNWRATALEVTARGGHRAFQPLTTDMTRFAPMKSKPHPTYIEQACEFGTSYQTFLALGALPDTMAFPGCELLFDPLEQCDFPTDITIHVRFVLNQQMLKKLDNAVRDADNNAVEAGGQARSFHTLRNRTLARRAYTEHEASNRPPGLLATVGLAIGARDRKTLDGRAERLQHLFGSARLERPVGDQDRLFLDHVPRLDTGIMRDYQAHLTPKQLAALMPVGTHHAGAATGTVRGYTVGGAKRPVRYDPTEAPRRARPPVVLLSGSQGSGKTISAQEIAIDAVVTHGSYLVDVDPKPDHHFEDVPELQGLIEPIDLATTDSTHDGMLDPLVIAPPGWHEDLATTYLTGLMAEAEPAWRVQIRKHVRAALQSPDPTCMHVLQGLLASDDPDARKAGESIGLWPDSPLGRLGFAQYKNGALNREIRRATTIKCHALQLPMPGQDRRGYDDNERLSVATLKLVAAYAMRLVYALPRDVHKLLVFDEAWFLLSSPDGLRLIDRLVRTIRALNATLLLISQSLDDVGNLEDLIGDRFIFGQESARQAKRGLEMVRLDPNDRHRVDQILRFRKGRCLYADTDNRVVDMQVYVPPDRLEILNTTPRERVT